jgi:nitroimidazol reductase NimA-like FMN-containing flavoprotein (pyridoxamine 5'-phosphate oxidase superfamily)
LVRMSTEEMEEFLKGPNLARVAVVRGDGSPFIVPVWYEWNGKYLYVVGRKRSSWVDDVRRNGRVCVLIDEDDSVRISIFTHLLSSRPDSIS